MIPCVHAVVCYFWCVCMCGLVSCVQSPSLTMTLPCGCENVNQPPSFFAPHRAAVLRMLHFGLAHTERVHIVRLAFTALRDGVLDALAVEEVRCCGLLRCLKWFS